MGTEVTTKVPTILLGEDEEAVRRVLSAQLAARGYSIYDASKGNEVLQAVPALHPDVIVLDLGLPDMDGVEVIDRLRRTFRTPIIVLSVRASESDKIAALNAGADDYLTKPYRQAELLERIRAALFRAKSNDRRAFVAGDLEVNLEDEAVHVGGKPIELTRYEFDLLAALVRNAGRLLTQGWLVLEVWGSKAEAGSLQLLRATVSALRSKIEADPSRPRHITTEPGVGYRLRTEA